ncbi:hypothetical protein [Nocardioides humi]|uniref:DUF4175 domain-containing protein n=1 Tax=Nocardioides humi TaxID=449461 RepID=A0ABN2A0C0_9ACTN|nr:hypothetical protein [Nocardioides humi]
MTEPRRFDPLGWFVSVCFTILAAAAALTIAVHLLQTVWVWLLVLAAIAAGVGVLVRLLVWRRRQSW